MFAHENDSFLRELDWKTADTLFFSARDCTVFRYCYDGYELGRDDAGLHEDIDHGSMETWYQMKLQIIARKHRVEIPADVKDPSH